MYDSKATSIPTDTFYIAIDSRYRDVAKFPTTSSYVVHLDTVFKNVISVELVHAIYDRPAGAVNMKYVNLFVDELSGNVTTNSDFMKGSFTQLPITESSMGRSLIYERNQYRSIKMFDKPLSKLARLTIRFMGYDGAVFPISDHYLRFEITCMKTSAIPEWKDMDIVSNSMNVFKTVQDEWNPKKLLGINDKYNEVELKNAFVKKVKTYKGVDKIKYEECKKAFKELYNGLTAT